MAQDVIIRGSKLAVVAAAVAMMTACGGGGGGALAPNPQASQPPGSGVLSTRDLKGSQGFVNSGGFTVYVFDADLADPGHSTCNSGNGCSQNWPPVAPPAGAPITAPFGTITRNDGSMQLTYAGRPLYTFVVDTQPGQTNGDNVTAFGGVWHIARPQQSNPSPSPTMTPSPY